MLLFLWKTLFLHFETVQVKSLCNAQYGHMEESYRWFDLRDREFTECRIRLCERMQVLERRSSRVPSRAQSVKSGRSMKARASERSKASSSPTKHLSLALLDAAAKAAKLQAEMEFFEKEKELRRLQLEKELAIASAEEKAIKRILQEDRLAADKEVSNELKQELKPVFQLTRTLLHSFPLLI